VNRESQESKVNDLMMSVDLAQEEMSHRYKISQLRPVSFMSKRMELMKNLSFCLAIAINVIILLAYGVNTPTAPLEANYTR
jgi:hypothetical protein